jgi:dextranase
MRIYDIYPTQGSFAPGEMIKLQVEIDAAINGNAQLMLEIRHLNDPPIVILDELELIAGRQIIPIQWVPPLTPGGYAARVELKNATGTAQSQATTAFDVLASWTDYPRYGFLSEFTQQRLDPDATMLELAHFHCNGLQFYDWQYRHDTLVAPTTEYIDPLGRPMSLAMIKKLVESARRHGIASMAYLVIYAASAEFWQAHPDWALFDENGIPIAFGENFLGLMDPSPGSPWSRHILKEAGKTLREIPFDGFHIDQYGDPKQAWNARKKSVDLPKAFVEFIHSAREQNPGKTILFNAVGNWPIEALARAPLDFLYIEVWPPQVEYQQLASIVLKAVELSQGKPVVIALYLPADHPANILVADAIILACGGTRIEVGEDAQLLVDPYFPKHQPIADELRVELYRFYNYAVRTGEWLGSYKLSGAERRTWSKAEFNPSSLTLEESVWSVMRQRPDGLCISLVNLNCVENPRWNIAHPIPVPNIELPVAVEYPRKPRQISWACPEQDRGPQALGFEYEQGKLHFAIPYLRYTGVIYIHD